MRRALLPAACALLRGTAAVSHAATPPAECIPCSKGPCCDPKGTGLCPGQIHCCADCGAAACECPSAPSTPAPPVTPAPPATPAPPPAPPDPTCRACSASSKACCDPSGTGLCPGGIHCCQCGAGACECPAPTPAPAAQCKLYDQTDMAGHDFGSASPGPNTTIQDCCNICGSRPGCFASVLYEDVCYLKTGGGDPLPARDTQQLAVLLNPPHTPVPTPLPATPPPVPVPPVDPQCMTWYDGVAHNPHNTAFRNVKAFGAIGDGVTDDTAAIEAALEDGRLDTRNTKLPAVVYLPPGTYLVRPRENDAALHMYFYTTLTGNSRCPPTIKLAPNSAPSPTPGVPQQTNYYVIGGPPSCAGCGHTDDFYYQLHNVKIDMSAPGNEGATGVHWPVSQGSSIRNVNITATGAYAGLFGESGSGGFTSDVRIEGGDYGIRTGSQQWLWRSITLSNQKVAAINAFWNWFTPYVDVHISGCPVGLQTGNLDAGDDGHEVNAIVFIDSSFTDVNVAVNATYNPGTTTNNTRRILLDRTVLTRVTSVTQGMAADPAGTQTYQSWYQGPALQNSQPLSAFRGTLPAVRADRPLELRPRPVYSEGGAFYNAMDAGAVGDGATDDTAALQKAVNEHDQVFLPHGVYLISDTIMLKSNTVLIGEMYSELQAKAGAAAFSNAASPKALLQTPDDPAGAVVLADLVFTLGSNLTGCIILDWQVGPASGIWDVHYRLYFGAHTLFHIHGSGAGYIENMWGWVGDHSMDEGTPVSVDNPRGMLVESQGPLWLYGAAFEHSSLYQYRFDGAANVVNLMFQSESPYWQDPPTAFGVQVANSRDIVSYGSGLYCFFHYPQETIFEVSGSTNISFYAHNTVRTNKLLTGDRTVTAHGFPWNVSFTQGWIANTPI